MFMRIFARNDEHMPLSTLYRLLTPPLPPAPDLDDRAVRSRRNKRGGRTASSESLVHSEQQTDAHAAPEPASSRNASAVSTGSVPGGLPVVEDDVWTERVLLCPSCSSVSPVSLFSSLSRKFHPSPHHLSTPARFPLTLCPAACPWLKTMYGRNAFFCATLVPPYLLCPCFPRYLASSVRADIPARNIFSTPVRCPLALCPAACPWWKAMYGGAHTNSSLLLCDFERLASSAAWACAWWNTCLIVLPALRDFDCLASSVAWACLTPPERRANLRSSSHFVPA